MLPIRPLPLRAALRSLCLMFCAGFGSGAALADVAAPVEPDRPKIALVLSGGGALGLAHVGAIQELERLGIRPDMVVGTSMGAVIGGLYASGLNGAELEAVVAEIDWAGVFSPEPDRDKLTFRQKQQQADFPGTASLGVSPAGILLPTGAVPDQALMKELRRLTPARTRLESFDELAIPFRAVATDIGTGEAVVLGAGELPMAMRASISLPGVFPAVRLDGKLLVDGGLAANVPISIARELGADIVIAVWTPNDLLPDSEIGSVVDVLEQTVSLLILANERAEIRTLSDADFLIRVDTGDISPAAFTESAELIKSGRTAMKAEAVRLAALAEARPPIVYAEELPDSPPVVTFVRIENTSRLDQTLLEAKLIDLVGQPAESARIDEALDRVYALGPFERVDYVFEEKNGHTGLVVRAEDNVPDAGQIRFGLIVENDFNTESDTAISLDFRSAALDSYGSEVEARVTLGDFNEVSAEYFRRLDARQNWFASVRGEVRNRPVNLFSRRGFKEAGFDLTYGLASVAGGYQFGNDGEVRVGMELGAGRAKLNEGFAPYSEVDIDIARLVASGTYDRLDDPFFPREGVRAEARWVQGVKALGDNADFQTVSASTVAAASQGPHTLIAVIAAGQRLDGTAPLDALYRVGGLFSLSGYRKEELAGENFLTTQLIYRRQLLVDSQQIFGLPLFVGGSAEFGDVWQGDNGLDTDNLRFGGSVFVATQTAFGPVYFAFGRSEGGRQSAYLLIGRTF
ncbi:MAG: BamA/TamA family outer membrane protein [Hyphomonas sp.]|uniref:patatin-like phospholipase family protein n=1 Tax=Hyphomonas sp. TaxID=87 RepID=UPI0017DBB536|nr:patatin-like phospholipase family protein [Hyphomonas sp.]MBU3922579.1 patatin-like phospholipase family protein [Alphaproteobacteria bacterium]MBA3068275.1 BamA/TamA family outer membrane protein [Hyphomonas sp.]MBU4060859.1 patatin-like phospholipase family protein [Alphaproteobacteria bacterium]MBU4164843.1 patatin-like phospholipase family protein [Alphaproteobacteria bacterium]MBU4567418.1 patatin-like phospholipase family protein [Alphaproteobacteria bacterium]